MEWKIGKKKVRLDFLGNIDNMKEKVGADGEEVTNILHN
jgi:hypothetical protein